MKVLEGLGEPVTRDKLSTQAYEQLRKAILNGKIPLGTRLVVRVLSQTFGISATPIKAALAALEQEGLVTTVPHRGYSVKTLTLQDFREITEIREVLEGLAARRAAEHTSPKLVRELQECIERQDICAKTADFEGYGDWDLRFHQALLLAAGSEWLLRLARSVHAHTRLVMLHAIHGPNRAASVVQEHTEIADAVAHGDAPRAEAAARRHIANVHARVARVIANAEAAATA